MKKILLLMPLLALSCADEKVNFDLQRAINAQSGEMPDTMMILPKKISPKKSIEEDLDYVPFFAPLAYYCDPNIYPPNIILTAKACRPFLNRFIRQGFPSERGYSKNYR